MAEIRRATAHDVEEIAAIIQDVWGQEINQKQASSLIKNEEQVIHVALVDGKTVGFIASFLSTTGAVRRWEVELLAVRQEYHGQGFGRTLIDATTSEGQERSVKFMRALIRVGNETAQRAFSRCGYTTDGHVYEMYLWEPKASGANYPSRGLVNLVPAETLTYRGLWIEGLDSQMLSHLERTQALAAAQAMAAEQGRLNVSTLIPVENKEFHDELFEGSVMNGQYQWWRHPG